MLVKNGRIIINEDSLEFSIKKLEKELQTFFESDSRFCNEDIEVFVEFDNECWNEKTCSMWNELSINIINHNKIIELGGKLAGEKRFAFSNITYTTENFEPCFIMNNGKPEFYYVFNGASWGITNSKNWENNRDDITVEDIIEKEVLSKFEV